MYFSAPASTNGHCSKVIAALVLRNELSRISLRIRRLVRERILLPSSLYRAVRAEQYIRYLRSFGIFEPSLSFRPWIPSTIITSSLARVVFLVIGLGAEILKSYSGNPTSFPARRSSRFSLKRPIFSASILSRSGFPFSSRGILSLGR